MTVIDEVMLSSPLYPSLEPHTVTKPPRIRPCCGRKGEVVESGTKRAGSSNPVSDTITSSFRVMGLASSPSDCG